MAGLQTIEENNRKMMDTQGMIDSGGKAISATMEKSSPLTTISGSGGGGGGASSGGTVFNDATRGLSLDTGRALTLTDSYAEGGMPYQNEAAPYDVVGPSPEELSFLKALENDPKNRLVGSVPKIGEKAELKTAQPKASSDTGFGKTVISEAGGAAMDTLGALKNAAVNDYQTDLTYWTAQGKTWFDPNSELEPDIDKYIEMMPSATDALGKGTASQGELSNSAGGRAALAVGTLGLSAAFKNKKQAEYIWNSGGEGAASGAMAGGWVGAIVGGLVGLVKGIFTWNSADEKDRDEKARARAQAELDRKNWTIAKNKRMIKEKETDYKARQTALETQNANKKAEKNEAELKKLTRISDGRVMVMRALMNAGNAGQNYRDQRLARKISRITPAKKTA